MENNKRGTIEYLDMKRLLKHVENVKEDVDLEYSNIKSNSVKLHQSSRNALIASRNSLLQSIARLDELVGIDNVKSPQANDSTHPVENLMTIPQAVPENIGCIYEKDSPLYLISNELERKHGYKFAYDKMCEDFNYLVSYYKDEAESDTSLYSVYVLSCILQMWFQYRHDVNKYEGRLSLKHGYVKWLDTIIIYFATLCVSYHSICLKSKMFQFKDQLLEWVELNDNAHTHNGELAKDKHSYKCVPSYIQCYDMNTEKFKPYEIKNNMDIQTAELCVCLEDMIKPILYNSSILHLSKAARSQNSYLHSIRTNLKRVANLSIDKGPDQLLNDCKILLMTEDESNDL